MEKIAIVIPAYNEENRIRKTLERYLDYFSKLKRKWEFKIIVVLNGCVDNTKEVVESLNSKNIILLDFKRAGKGFAITEGFKEALKRNFDLIGFIDADGATPPNAFLGLIKNLGNADGIIADRWHKKSKISPKQTAFRRFISRVFNIIVRGLFLIPYRDTQAGAKLFKKEVLKKIIPKLGASEWSFDIDLLFYSRRTKAKIKSIPTEWHDQKGSKVNLKKTPGKMFFSVIRLRIVHSPFKFLLRAHSKLPKILQVGYWFG